jgi:hypothetical protein
MSKKRRAEQAKSMSEAPGILAVVQEPRGRDLDALLDLVAKMCTTMVLITGPHLAVAESGSPFLTRIKQHCIARSVESEWPGTKRLGSTAGVFKYRIRPELLKAFRADAEGLYEWQRELPEDPSFLREDGTAYFVTIAHERESYFWVRDDEERSEVLAALPASMLESVRYQYDPRKWH